MNAFFRIGKIFPIALIGKFIIVAAKVPPRTIKIPFNCENQNKSPPLKIIPTIMIEIPDIRPIIVPKSIF